MFLSTIFDQSTIIETKEFICFAILTKPPLPEPSCFVFVCKVALQSMPLKILEVALFKHINPVYSDPVYGVNKIGRGRLQYFGIWLVSNSVGHVTLKK